MQRAVVQQQQPFIHEGAHAHACAMHTWGRHTDSATPGCVLLDKAWAHTALGPLTDIPQCAPRVTHRRLGATMRLSVSACSTCSPLLPGEAVSPSTRGLRPGA